MTFSDPTDLVNMAQGWQKGSHPSTGCPPPGSIYGGTAPPRNFLVLQGDTNIQIAAPAPAFPAEWRCCCKEREEAEEDEVDDGDNLGYLA